ncbi:MAG: hypothetical protein ACK4F0_02990 [Candidatus Ratteibacteria bacterium]
MRFAINQATTLTTDFKTDIKAYSKAGFKAIEIWLPKLKKYLAEVIDYVEGNEIFFHINNVFEKSRKTLINKDRIFLEEGIIPLETIIKKLQNSGFSGYYSLELFNEKLWGEEPYSVAKKCFENLKKLEKNYES